jgi:hypothetical protein
VRYFEGPPSQHAPNSAGLSQASAHESNPVARAGNRETGEINRWNGADDSIEISRESAVPW